VELFCQTFFKTTSAPPEKPLHQRSRSCFSRSRSSTKRALNESQVQVRAIQLNMMCLLKCLTQIFIAFAVHLVLNFSINYYGVDRNESLVDGQIKLRIRSHRWSIKSSRILVHIKVTMLLCHIHLMDQLLHSFGRILATMRLWIIVGCICSHIIFNILLFIQVVPYKDRLLLAIIWSKETLIAVRRVRRM